MQMAIIEFARNVCGLDDSHSTEFAPECDNPVISLMESQQHVTDMGGTMRLGAYPCRLRARLEAPPRSTGSPRSASATATATRSPTSTATCSCEHGMRLSGLSPDGSLVEMIELADHPWFIGCQFHPGAEVAPHAPASAVRRVHRRRGQGQASPRLGAGRRIARRGRRLNVPIHFRRDALFLIAGPCVLEDDALNLRVGEHLARLAERVPGGIIFKASFDKANRSNAGAHRGPGLDDGLAALERVRAATGLPMLTDVHLPEQCAPAAEVADVLQIPAFLCRQTDLLVAAGATGKAGEREEGPVDAARGDARRGREGACVAAAGARSDDRGDRARDVLRLRRSRRRHAQLRADA